jgi:arachidonate 15-lipoxygenase
MVNLKREYQYNYSHIPPLAMVNELPKSERFSNDWYKSLAKQLRQLFRNTLIANRGNQGSKSIEDDVKSFLFETLLQEALSMQLATVGRLLQIAPQLLINGLSDDLNEIDDVLFKLIRTTGLSIFRDVLRRVNERLLQQQRIGHVTHLNEYDALYPVIGVPQIAQTFQSDEAFANLQVAGFNPVMLRRITELGDRFPVQDAQYQAVMGCDDSLAAAGQEGRLYLTDYKILENAVNGTRLDYQKYCYAPLALFAVPRGTESHRLLRPIAIQCHQTPGPDNPIVTPQSGKYAWLFAKTVVQIADANYHEAVSHLGRTHLFVGSFVIATQRCLPDNHPLSLLLRPHFEGTLAINDAAQRILIARNGGVDHLLSTTIDNARVLAAIGVQTYGFNTAMLPKQLKERGVDDPAVLPVYPYRDDALLVWNAIHQWVSDYLSLYYASDEAIQGDTALQDWAHEAQALDGGRVPDFGEGQGIQTRHYLIDAVTLIIFTASAQHAAVNFPQKDLMSYAAAQPMAGYMPASILKGEVTEEQYLKLLPPLEQAQRQLNLLHLLGSIHYNTLGDYSEGHFTDPKVAPWLQTFQTNLAQIEATIKQRNESRPRYEYLLPSKIPQSINI